MNPHQLARFLGWFSIALDLAALAAACTSDNPQRDNALVAIGAVAGVTALDIYAAEQLG